MCLSPRGKVGFDVNVGGCTGPPRFRAHLWRAPGSRVHPSRVSPLMYTDKRSYDARVHVWPDGYVFARSFDATKEHRSTNATFPGRQKVISTNEIRLYQASTLNLVASRAPLPNCQCVTLTCKVFHGPVDTYYSGEFLPSPGDRLNSPSEKILLRRVTRTCWTRVL